MSFGSDPMSLARNLGLGKLILNLAILSKYHIRVGTLHGRLVANIYLVTNITKNSLGK